MDPGRQNEQIKGETLDRLLAVRAEFLRFIEKRVGSAAIAEDILQAAFVRGIERVGTIRDTESSVAWFYRILRNAIVDHYRHQQSGARALEQWARELESSDVPEEFERDEICRCLSCLVDELKPEYKQAITVIDLEDGKLRDLAEKTGISKSNAAVRVHRARQALLKRVKLACGVCATHGCIDCRCGSLPNDTR